MRGFEISPLYMHDIYKTINNKPERKKKEKSLWRHISILQRENRIINIIENWEKKIIEIIEIKKTNIRGRVPKTYERRRTRVSRGIDWWLWRLKECFLFARKW